MKAKLTTKIAQHFARLAEPVVGNSRQFARKTKTIMKRTSAQLIPVIALGCSALLYFVTGCSSAPEAPPKEVTIQADDKMRYDVTAFDASPGQKIAVTIKNIGTTPKFSMGHNFVMLDRIINTGNMQSAFLDKASTEASHDYVPPGARKCSRIPNCSDLGKARSSPSTRLTSRGSISMSARSPAIIRREPRVS